MRPFRTITLGILALGSAAAIALPSLGSAAEAASSINYVDLGDSYSSGVGTGTESGSCGQSSQAFGPLWASKNGATLTFAACSGAKTTDVVSSQVSKLSSATTLVSVTAGGNDVGFTSIMETCVLESDSACQSAVNSAITYAQNTLPGQLNTMFSNIHSHAPNAKVIELDYPVFYDTSVPICIGLDSTKHKLLDNGINILDGVLKTAAANNNATFADVRNQFSGHELCDGAGWLHSVDFSNIGESYHPTATGQSSGYLPVFSSAATSVGQ
jgi:lysophospholipase L1-like esterase